MTKLRRIKFKEHPVLGNIELDFCDKNNKAVDTVIIAGENGTGKTIILNCFYDMCQSNGYGVDCLEEVELEQDGKIYFIRFSRKDRDVSIFKDTNGMENIWSYFKNTYIPNAVFSSTEINFTTKGVNSITSNDLDTNSKSCKTDINMAQETEQLLVDIYDADNSVIGDNCRKYGQVRLAEIDDDLRINRFSSAFNSMFEDVEFSTISNENNRKVIYFKKNNQLIPIESLSSGEKQIIYRGCFLLRDKEALKGAFVLIDEPEISMHPSWQKKIMDYYKNIFTDEEGNQTSQIFAVTHSPFIIHNEHRANDKVIVLSRNEDGKVEVSDKPEYFKAESIEVVEDSFHIDEFRNDKPIAFVEGKTDEQYFNKAVEVFGMEVPFEFKTVGSHDKNGKAKNTGDGSVKKVFDLLSGVGLNKMNVCLVDCDSKFEDTVGSSIVLIKNPIFESSKGIVKGIENALVLDDIDIEEYYHEEKNSNGYGKENIRYKLNKTALCDYVCSLDKNKQKEVLKNLKDIIEGIIKKYY